MNANVLFRSFQEKFQLCIEERTTPTLASQIRVEDMCQDEAQKLGPKEDEKEWKMPFFDRDHHLAYTFADLSKCPTYLDASRPWLCYWSVHSLNLLNHTFSHDMKSKIVTFLKTCESPEGGYGGGPGQIPHLAPTYAAVLALATLRCEEALASINRETLANFLRSVHQTDGSYIMHTGGEVDMRGVYCALAVAKLTKILDQSMIENTPEWIISCQTYEGGFGGEPGTEAHGGYTFCAMGALTILGKAKLAEKDSLLKWLSNRQMRFEGGFCGRSNKLVDACYSFWQGAVFRLIDMELEKEEQPTLGLAFDTRALEEYLLICCQDPRGGFRDKPDRPRDLYHTCYGLSGLAVAQSYDESKQLILGGEAACLPPIDPVLNITAESETFASSYFERLLSR
ncbi:unnamed protein product, partial [Mesorhabditis belari]|uniref:Protein farnesyltransferase subunit beta n=1 Tax=Mesorhabditis belari TaxID=2138241 RepID=A0AAF3FN51_9BILA